MSSDRLHEGEVVAIEPFATNGAGEIENGAFGNIVRFRSEPGPGMPIATAWFERFRTLPFTARWIPAEERSAIAKVRRMLQSYPIFMERGGGLVAQGNTRSSSPRRPRGGPHARSRGPALRRRLTRTKLPPGHSIGSLKHSPSSAF